MFHHPLLLRALLAPRPIAIPLFAILIGGHATGFLGRLQAATISVTRGCFYRRRPYEEMNNEAIESIHRDI